MDKPTTDDTGTVTEPAQSPDQPTEQPADTDTVDYWKQRARQHERQAKANADAARRLQEIEDAQKTEAQRLTDRLTAAEQEATSARLDALRYRVGLSQGIPADLISRLQGSTEDELIADAQVLAQALSVQPGPSITASKPVTSMQLGATPTDAQHPTDHNDVARRLLLGGK